MDSRPLRIFALGLVGMIGAFLIAGQLAYVFLAGALVPLILLVAGQFYLPRSRRALTIWFNPCLILDENGEWTETRPGDFASRLSGKVFEYSYFKQWHEFQIVTHRFWLLAGIGLLSLGAACLVLWLKDELLDGIAILYPAGPCWVVVVLLASRWLWERRILRREGLALGTFSVYATSKMHRLHARYHFVDPEGEHRGGTVVSMFCDLEDDMTIVFYDEANPERSFPASALMFHKLVWKQKPSAKQESSAASKEE